MTEARLHRDFRETESSSRSSSTTTTVAHGARRVEITPMDYEAIRTCYVDVLGAMNGVKARDIEAAIDGGLDASAILDALEETALAPRPSHYYLRAILRRYMAQGICTRAQAEQERQAFRARREAADQEAGGAWYKNPALNYQQRTYSDDQFSDSFYIDLDKYGRA